MGSYVFRRTELSVLEALAVYRFLTAKQLLRIGVTPSRSHLYDVLRTLALRRPKLVHELDFGVEPEVGRLDRIFRAHPRRRSGAHG